MVSDVPVDYEAPVVTSRIFRSASAQSFGGAHRGRVCVRVFIGCECACVLCASSLYCVILQKKLRRRDCELACSPMVGRSSGTLPTRVQILVLAPFPGIFLGFTGVTR